MVSTSNLRASGIVRRTRCSCCRLGPNLTKSRIACKLNDCVHMSASLSRLQPNSKISLTYLFYFRVRDQCDQAQAHGNDQSL